MPIKIDCYGAAREVGRSSFLVDAGDKVLLDHGIKLGPEQTDYPPVIKSNLNAIILSHAHLDHSGNIPHFLRYSHALTFMTPPTLELSKLLWYDSIKIADKEGEPPKFNKSEIERVEKYAFPTNYGRRLKVTDKISFEFLDAGHIMGAALTKLYLGNKTLLYTGDFKDEETRLFPAADVDGVGEVDYLMIESCYGNREHTPRKEAEKKFIDSVKETLDNGGHALVPAFAIGRTQELIEVLYEHNIEAPVYMDGMGQKAAKIFFHYPEYLKAPTVLKRAMENTIWVEGNKDRKKALAQPSVIVTTAGQGLLNASRQVGSTSPTTGSPAAPNRLPTADDHGFRMIAANVAHLSHS